MLFYYLDLLELPATIIHIFACVLLVIIVLIQPGKSGGLGAAFGGSGGAQVFGGRGAGDLMSKLTWWTAGVFFACSMFLAYLSSASDSLRDAPETPLAGPTTEAPTPEGTSGLAPPPETPGTPDAAAPAPSAAPPAEEAPPAGAPPTDGGNAPTAPTP